MFEKQQSYLLYGNRFCGIEHTTKQGMDIIYAMGLKRSKNELNTTQILNANSVETIAAQLSKHQHAVLIINNDKVLHKTLEGNFGDAQKAVYKAYPNINLNDFYYEVLSEADTNFVALCRRDYIDSLISEYKTQKIYIINVTLGNHASANLKPFTNSENLLTSNALVMQNGQGITQIEALDPDTTNYNINGIEVSNTELLSFSGALQAILKTNPTDTNFSEEKTRLENEFKDVRFFSQFLKFGGLFILILLLINFFVFNYYFNQVSDLNQLSEINASTKQKITALNEVVTKKQKTVDDLLKNNGSKSSYYANDIMHSLPESIRLSELNYQPLLKRIKVDKPVELDSDKLIISGSSNDSEAFTQWISQLEKMDWVNQVVTEHYGTSSSKNANFTINITIADAK